ncbi:MAG TPA: dihydrodipicolinate synthase family protein [Acidobacteriaceae bacterium]|nr:dihydrodipicolinate synthase family protein [Acidobacteriaceae bacterium]
MTTRLNLKDGLVLDRRSFVKAAGAVAVSAALPRSLFAAAPAGSKTFQGLFPIAASPFTPDDKLDLDCLAAEVKFCDRARVPGLIWPQIASGWTTLSKEERFAGAEAMCAAGKGGKAAVVIGVQTKGDDLPGAIAFAKHAAQHGANAICSLPPTGGDAAVMEYYKAIGSATDLPLFVQTSGNMSVDLVAQLFRTIPTMRVVKDEAGDPLARVTDLRAKTDGKLAIFAGKGVRQMMDEMRLGFTGFCPTMGQADIFQQAWELWEAGKKRESFDMFGRTQAFSSILNADRYVLVARGIFKEDTASRPTPGMGNSGKQEPLTDAEKKVVRDALDAYLKPYLRG